jgi:hypothetical protein
LWIERGIESATVAEESNGAGWAAVNGIVRIMVGDDMSCCLNPVGWHQIITKKNITDPNKLPQEPSIPTVYLKAWGR